MFYQKVSKRSREAMSGFLARHYRYNTMNSWNQSTSYANNVKVPNLDVPQELQELAYDVAGGEVEAPDWDMFFARTVTDFYRRTGFHIGQWPQRRLPGAVRGQGKRGRHLLYLPRPVHGYV